MLFLQKKKIHIFTFPSLKPFPLLHPKMIIGYSLYKQHRTLFKKQYFRKIHMQSKELFQS